MHRKLYLACMIHNVHIIPEVLLPSLLVLVRGMVVAMQNCFRIHFVL